MPHVNVCGVIGARVAPREYKLVLTCCDTLTGQGAVRFPLDVLSDGRRHTDKQRCTVVLAVCVGVFVFVCVRVCMCMCTCVHVHALVFV